MRACVRACMCVHARACVCVCAMCDCMCGVSTYAAVCREGPQQQQGVESTHSLWLVTVCVCTCMCAYICIASSCVFAVLC